MQVLVTEPANLILEDMTDDEFFEFCVRNQENRIERTAEGKVVIMPGTGGKTGNRNMRLSAQLSNWADADGRGAGFDSSTMFRLPNTAMRSPDGSWVPFPRLARLTPEQKEKFLPLCPDFVIELTSPSDRLPQVQEKMDEWMANGCQLGWILDTKTRQAHVYRASGVEILDNPTELRGEGPVAGFTLGLARIWDPGW
jgi:Uma2 family endonuclease